MSNNRKPHYSVIFRAEIDELQREKAELTKELRAVSDKANNNKEVILDVMKLVGNDIVDNKDEALLQKLDYIFESCIGIKQVSYFIAIFFFCY